MATAVPTARHVTRVALAMGAHVVGEADTHARRTITIGHAPSCDFVLPLQPAAATHTCPVSTRGRPLTLSSQRQRSSRIPVGAITSRVAVKGSDTPASTPVPSWCTCEVLPCSSSGARPTVAPSTTPSAW